ncbi:MAG: phosphatidate cytidylyltransferase [Syntrophomonadaceae bacterium]|nr:phosphatidate cytidylyltransferase [Syntrophomonadaceae bacterium]
MLKTRLLTAAVGIPFLIGMAYLGGVYWQVLVGLLAAVALLEFLAMMRSKGFHPCIVSAILLAAVILFRIQLAPYLPGLFLAGLLLMIIGLVLTYPQRNINDLALSLFGSVYSGFFFSYALALGSTDGAFYLLLLVFILTWASDVGGYFFGRMWGKHKLAPRLSPGKTTEGSAGAIVLTILAACLCQYLPGNDYPQGSVLLVMAVAVSIAAQLGDLLESSIKRFFAVKDSGRLLPGHGGVLDRFDSFMLVCPVIYYFLVVL